MSSHSTLAISDHRIPSKYIKLTDADHSIAAESQVHWSRPYFLLVGYYMHVWSFVFQVRIEMRIKETKRVVYKYIQYSIYTIINEMMMIIVVKWWTSYYCIHNRASASCNVNHEAYSQAKFRANTIASWQEHMQI